MSKCVISSIASLELSLKNILKLKFYIWKGCANVIFLQKKNSYSFTSCSDTVVKNVFENGASLLQIYFNIFLVLDIFSGNTLMNWLASKTIFFLQLTTNYDVIPVKRQINIARVALNKMKNWNIILFNSKNIYLMTKY